MDELKHLLATFGAQYPWAIFLAIAILPAFGFPASALLLLAGMVWGSNATSCVIALAAVLLNILATHSFAAGPGKKLVTRLLGARARPLGNLSAADHVRLSWIIRITPGVPLFVQNYVLGIVGVTLRQSLLAALPVTGLYVCGFVLTGGAIFDGAWGLAITGICLVVATGFAARMMRRRCPATGIPEP